MFHLAKDKQSCGLTVIGWQCFDPVCCQRNGKAKVWSVQYTLGQFGVILIFITSYVVNLPFRAWHSIKSFVSSERIVCASVENTSFASAGNPPWWWTSSSRKREMHEIRLKQVSAKCAELCLTVKTHSVPIKFAQQLDAAWTTLTSAASVKQWVSKTCPASSWHVQHPPPCSPLLQFSAKCQY